MLRLLGAGVGLAWRAYSAELDRAGIGRGWRAWGFWKYELGEEQPEGRDEETIRLAELGQLTEEERATIAADAERCREFAKGGPFFHGSDKGAQEKIDLHERVERVLQ